MSSIEKNPPDRSGHARLRLMLPSSVLPARAVMLLAILWAACAFPAHAADDYHRSYTVTGRAHVHVHADDSSVRVFTSDSNQVEFHARLEGYAWGIVLSQSPQMESHQDGNFVELDARLRLNILIGGGNRHMSIDVHMPRNADLEVETGDGSVELASLDGKIAVHTGDGRIQASQLSGSIELRSGDGSIIADALQGDMQLHTGDGRIRASNLVGRCAASSGDGSIQVQGRFDALALHSSDGTLIARVEPGSQMLSAWSLHTSDGAVRLMLPRDFKASLDASTGDGHIATDLPWQVEGLSTKHLLRGTLNGGGPPLQIFSGDGSIDLMAL
jgi:hypothetical protein